MTSSLHGIAELSDSLALVIGDKMRAGELETYDEIQAVIAEWMRETFKESSE